LKAVSKPALAELHLTSHKIRAQNVGAKSGAVLFDFEAIAANIM